MLGNSAQLRVVSFFINNSSTRCNRIPGEVIFSFLRSFQSSPVLYFYSLMDKKRPSNGRTQENINCSSSPHQTTGHGDSNSPLSHDFIVWFFSNSNIEAIAHQRRQRMKYTHNTYYTILQQDDSKPDYVNRLNKKHKEFNPFQTTLR